MIYSVFYLTNYAFKQSDFFCKEEKRDTNEQYWNIVVVLYFTACHVEMKNRANSNNFLTIQRYKKIHKEDSF